MTPLDGQITDYVKPAEVAPGSAAEVLRRAKAWISDPARWTQDTQGRTRQGEICAATDPKATQWCAHGAVAVVGGHSTPAHEFLHRAAGLLTGDPHYGGGSYNNSHTHAEVMGLMDLAIKLAGDRP